MAKIKEIAENAYLFIKAKWLPMLLTAGFLAFSLQSLQINNFVDEQSRDRSNAVQTIIDDNRTQQDRSIESSENVMCYTALDRPDLFPNANLAVCRERLRVINNADGTFLSDEAIK